MRTLLVILPLAMLGQSGPPARPPTTAVETCVTAECHVKETKFKFLHAPTAAGACEMCHQPLDVSKHTFTFRQTGAAMCDFCHIGKTDSAGLHVHAPVQNGQCTSCHNPHGSDLRNLINGESVGGMCLSCHQNDLARAQNPNHAGLGWVDRCDRCHLPRTWQHAEIHQ